MHDSDVESAISMMGGRPRGRAGRFQISCPLAPWTHSKGEDKSPSCSVLSSDKHGIAVFHCFACGAKGSLRKLAKLYAQHSGDVQALEFINSIEGETGWAKIAKDRDYENYRKGVGKRVQGEVLKPATEENVKEWCQFVPKYALKRGVTMEQIKRWEIGYDLKEKRLIFTIRDWQNKLIGVSGRDLTGEKKAKYKHYPGTQKELVLYGEKFSNPAVERAYLVEGFLDVLALERLGVPNCLAVMGSSLSEQQIKNLSTWFKEVVFIPDGDMEGLKFNEKYSEELRKHLSKVGIAGVEINPEFKERTESHNWEPYNFKFKVIDLLKGRDPDDLNKEELDQVLTRIEWI